MAIGEDEWVARSGERMEGYSGWAAPARRVWDRVPFGFKLAAFGALGASLPLLTGSDFTLRIGINTLLLAMLALGLNVVVGWAGLLDLGYVAFYGFGAYGYALLSSEQLGVHLATIPAIVIVVAASALLGLLLGLPSWRLIGDYLAIVTLFFGQLFVELVVNLDRVTLPGSDEPLNIIGGPDGIAGVDPMSFFGLELLSTADYYLLCVVVLVALTGVLHLISDSRIGRAWRAVREDPLAAGFMTMPVNRLKLLAFVVGSAVAGLAGTIFAAVQIGVFPRSFETPFLILIYAAVILGGAGSIPGMIIGAIVVSVSLELLRDADQATTLFFLVILAVLLWRVRPWQRLVAVLGGLVAFGLVLHAVLAAAWPAAVDGEPSAGGLLGAVLEPWLAIPADPGSVGNFAFVALIVGIMAVSRLHGWWRTAALVPLIYLAAFTWESRLVLSPSITRQLLLGALLIAVMSVRPQGILGTRKVEIV